FFQAEDGIRAGHVTGVQTCALPISLPRSEGRRLHGGGGGHLGRAIDGLRSEGERHVEVGRAAPPGVEFLTGELAVLVGVEAGERSEERRVGKGCWGAGWTRLSQINE